MENLESPSEAQDDATALLCSPRQPCFVGMSSLQGFRAAR